MFLYQFVSHLFDKHRTEYNKKIQTENTEEGFSDLAECLRFFGHSKINLNKTVHFQIAML